MKALLALFLFLLSSLAHADIRPQHSGAWYNATQSGHGLSVQVLDDERTIAFWYAYTPDGHPMFLVIDGVNDHHTVAGPAYYHEGMIWGLFDPDTLHSDIWGEVNIEFLGCNRAVLTWSAESEGYGLGQIELERLSYVAELDCDEVPSEMTGEWEAQILDKIGNPYVDGGPFKVTLDADGEFSFDDALPCRWEGHIHLNSEQSGLLTAVFGSPMCAPAIPMSLAFGRYYSSGATFCGSGGACVTYDQMISMTIDYDSVYGGTSLLFLR